MILAISDTDYWVVTEPDSENELPKLILVKPEFLLPVAFIDSALSVNVPESLISCSVPSSDPSSVSLTISHDLTILSVFSSVSP